MPILGLPEPPLSDERITLRPWSHDDVDLVYAAFQDPELHRWLLEVPDPYTRSAAEGFIVERTAGWLSGSQAAFAIVERTTGRVVGGVTLYPDGREGILAYWLAREWRGRGFATRAVRLVSRWAFDGLDVDRLSLWTLIGNERSERVAERAGFRREGIRPGFARQEGETLDATLFRLTKEEDAATRSLAGTATAEGSGSAGAERHGSIHTSGMSLPVEPPDPPLVDPEGRFRLRPFRREDAPQIATHCQDPEIPRWIPLIPRPYTLDVAIGYVETTERSWREGTSFEFAIADAASDRVLGSIGLHPGPEHRAAIGYWVARDARGRGIATRAVRLVSGWAFARFPIGRISLWTLPGNRASQTVAERAGYRYEGILRRWDRDKDEPTDVVMFGLTRDDLPDLEAGVAGADGAAGAAVEATPGAVRLAAAPPELRAPGTRAAPFVDLIAVDELAAGTMCRVTRAGIDLLVAATPEGIIVTDDRCPHMAAPLSIGELDGCVVACPLHEGRFDLCTGETVQMPTTGGLDADGAYHGPWSKAGSSLKPEPPSKKLEARRLTRVNRLRYYPARIRDGRLEAQLPIVPE